MSNGGSKRTRSERVAALELPPGRVSRTLGELRRGSTLLRVGLCVLTAFLLWVVMRGWAPPLGYREGYVPQREVVSRVAFRKPDQAATDAARQVARGRVRYVYEQNPETLEQLRSALRNQVQAVISAEKLSDVDPSLWREFEPPAAPDAVPPAEEVREQAFQEFRAAFSGPEVLEKFQSDLAEAFSSWERHGLLDQLPREHTDGNQDEIFVYPHGAPNERDVAKLSDVLLGDGAALKQSLLINLDSTVVAERSFAWLMPRLRELKSTLKIDLSATQRERELAAAQQPEVLVTYEAGSTLAKAAAPLTANDLDVLALEHQSYLASLTTLQHAVRSLAVLGTIGGLFVLIGYFVVKREKQLFHNLSRLGLLLGGVLLGVGAARMAAVDPYRAELLPVLFMCMTFAISYRQEIALLIAAGVSLLVALEIGSGIGGLLLLLGTSCTAILLLTRIRSRSKITKVAFVAALVAAALSLVQAALEGQPLSMDMLYLAARNAGWTLASGILMTGMLPYIESLFGVVTDISLLELGDVAHPLLQELVRRAPGTYNHSINVASIAEAAAEAIGANGLLVRVGAYFHDIGKMFKPGYFVENQGAEANRHESLVPAMSTLIIIAHIKDGADLARQHHLPQSIIDFIEQHHGTTLVEYFYNRARQNEGEHGNEVQESAFRYPGPKPQSREAAILMLADAAESASRVLIEPTPARIESLVREIAMKRLLDGQFDECGLTLRQLRTVENRLIKSLTAVYHARVKYPDQQRTA
ncbi:MAG: HDIG domain-containing protein [Pirellulales bacterium]|nr:HDIG domain-containing protein [Pirellulales bacterium]